jgi:hypothetical protein
VSVVAVQKIENLVFPEYYPEFSSERYHNGLDDRNTSSEFTKITDQEKADKLAKRYGIFICIKSIH